MAFERHDRQWLRRRPSWGKQATINGKPAWLVVQERREAAKENTNA